MLNRRELLMTGVATVLPASMNKLAGKTVDFPDELTDRKMCETILWSKSRVIMTGYGLPAVTYV